MKKLNPPRCTLPESPPGATGLPLCSVGGFSYHDVRWQRKRLEILQRDDFECQRCHVQDNRPLNVHHITYFRGRELWDYPDELLITLCEGCHKYEHDNFNVACENLIQKIKASGLLSDEINALAKGTYSIDTLLFNLCEKPPF